jgi:hypothetical protein
MKKIIAVLSVLTVPAYPQDVEIQSVNERAVEARVASVRGSPRGPGGELAKGARISSGSTLTTGAGDALLLYPAPDMKAVVLQDSEIRFSSASVGENEWKAVIELIEGTVFGLVDPSEASTSSQLTIISPNGTISCSNGKFLVEQRGDRTTITGAQGEVSVSAGEGGAPVTVGEANVLVLQPGAGGRLETQLVDLATGTVVSIGEDGSKGEPQRADPLLLAQAAESLANAISVVIAADGGVVSAALQNLIQQVAQVVPAFDQQVSGQQAPPQQAAAQMLNADFVASLTSADAAAQAAQPDMTQPVVTTPLPVASPDSP